MNKLKFRDDLVMKEDDISTFHVQLMDKYNKVYELPADATLKAYIGTEGSELLEVEGQIEDATEGWVSFKVKAALEVGVYDCEITVTSLANDEIQTFPQNGYAKFTVTQNIRNRDEQTEAEALLASINAKLQTINDQLTTLLTPDEVQALWDALS